MGEWKDVSLGEIIKLQRGHDLTEKARKPGKIPVMGSAGQNGYHNISKAKGPGIVLGRSGASFGKVHFCKSNYWPHNTGLYVTNFLGNDELFIFYFLKTIDFSYYNSGSAQPSLNRNHIYLIPVRIPPFPEQKSIAHILGSLDDKIELNRQMNATLEGMAQALFKSWFVDFDPVIDNALTAGNPIPEAFTARAETRRKALAHGTANRDVAKQFPAAFQFTEEMGWIPEGWEVKKSESIVTRKKVNQKFTKKNVLPTGDIPVFDQGAGLLLGYHNGLPDIESSQKNPNFIFGDHTCITHLSTKPFSVGPNVIPLEAKNYNSYWTYFAIKDIQKFQEYRRHWMEFKIKTVLMPRKNLASLFGNFIQNLYISIESQTDKSVILTHLRDTLLPKLISGEIRIPEAEKITEEALA